MGGARAGAKGVWSGMKHQPTPDCISNDEVQTPPELCRKLVYHFRPEGYVLEPCRGRGNFYKALEMWDAQFSYPRIEFLNYCEINEGRDFLTFVDEEHDYDWIITNPPFSQAKAFMEKSFQVADNVVFLITLNHALGLKARFRLLDKYGFGIREAVLLDTPPKPWPQAGFQLGAVYFQRGYQGAMTWTDFRELTP